MLSLGLEVDLFRQKLPKDTRTVAHRYANHLRAVTSRCHRTRHSNYVCSHHGIVMTTLWRHYTVTASGVVMVSRHKLDRPYKYATFAVIVGRRTIHDTAADRTEFDQPYLCPEGKVQTEQTLTDFTVISCHFHISSYIRVDCGICLNNICTVVLDQRPGQL